MNARLFKLSLTALFVFALGAGCVDGTGTDASESIAPDEPTARAGQALGGVDCLGGTYENGQCQPFALAGNQNRPFALALNGTRMVWTEWNGGKVHEESLLGGTVKNIASKSQGPYGPTGIAVGSGYVFFGTQQEGNIYRIALDTPDPDPQVLASNQGGPIQLAVSGKFVYWANYDSGEIVRLPIRPSAVDFPEVLASGQDHPWGLSVHGDDVYWSNASGTSPSISRLHLGNNQIDTRALNGQPYSVATDDTAVYWVSYTQGTVNRIKFANLPLSTGQIEQLASGQYYPIGLTLDQNYVYWTNRAAQTWNGTIMRADLAGGNVTQLTAGQANPLSITNDSTALYWLNDALPDCASGACGTLMKMAK